MSAKREGKRFIIKFVASAVKKAPGKSDFQNSWRMASVFVM
jgi:hypothetical protein